MSFIYTEVEGQRYGMACFFQRINGFSIPDQFGRSQLQIRLTYRTPANCIPTGVLQQTNLITVKSLFLLASHYDLPPAWYGSHVYYDDGSINEGAKVLSIAESSQVYSSCVNLVKITELERAASIRMGVHSAIWTTYINIMQYDRYRREFNDRIYPNFYGLDQNMLSLSAQIVGAVTNSRSVISIGGLNVEMADRSSSFGDLYNRLEMDQTHIDG